MIVQRVCNIWGLLEVDVNKNSSLVGNWTGSVCYGKRSADHHLSQTDVAMYSTYLSSSIQSKIQKVWQGNFVMYNNETKQQGS